MIVGVLRIQLHIPSSSSLKEKRRHLNALKSRIRSSFNASVAEVGGQEKWQRSEVAVACVGMTRQVVDSVLARIVAAVESFDGLQVVDYETELIG